LPSSSCIGELHYELGSEKHERRPDVLPFAEYSGEKIMPMLLSGEVLLWL
jgi:hypothetical protein